MFKKVILLYYILIIQNVSSFTMNDNLIFYIIDIDLQLFSDHSLVYQKSLGKSYQAKRVIVCFDFGRSYYRNDLLDSYKANRKKPTDPETVEKFDKFFSCLNSIPDQIPFENYKFRGVEADDIIAAITQSKALEDWHKVILSNDKDFMQLCDEKTILCRPAKKPWEVLNTNRIVEDLNVHPINMALARAIVGDKSDNIGGINGVGYKTLSKSF